MFQAHHAPVLIFFFIWRISNGEEYSCDNTICNPRAGDLLIGRESSLWASSTCGLKEVQAYCVVTTSGKSYCKECTSSQPYNALTNPESHRIDNVVSRVPSNPGRWWQSENGLNNVTIVLNLDTQFQFISTILRFKTYRPAAMYLERSYDFGRSWKRYAYFSNNCKRDFPGVPEGPRRFLTDVTCTGVYSQLTPSEGGVVAYMAAPSEMHESWPQYSKERMNLTAITNLRAVFTRLNTLGDINVDNSSVTQRKYYYALYEWNVWGRCTCFGHAKRCKPKSTAEIIKPEKVYGVCECTHNTAGENCETCAEFHWNKPWRPATKDSPNACERCECNDHATACFFNPVLYASSGNVSGGNCHGCMHNTEGVNCEYCKQNYYRHPAYPINHPLTCQPCNCHTDGTLYEGFCQQYTVPEQNTIAGQCLCKKNVGGEKCDRCKVGHWNFQAGNPEGCEPCSCNMMGTVDNGGCDPYTGVCTCKRFVGGPNCDQCLEGYFNLSLAPLGCQECACSQLGSKNAVCNSVTGQCECKTGFTGRDCASVEDGYYVRPPSEIIDGPGEKEITLDGPKGQGRFVIVLDVDPKQFGEGDEWTINVKPYQHGATRCQNPTQTVRVFQDTSKIIISDVCLEAGLPLVLRIMPETQPTGPYTEILITDIVLIPTEDSHLARRCEDYREIAMDILLGRSHDRSALPPECEVYFRLPRVSWRETGSVAERCMCNTTGSLSEVCDKLTGQCPCKPGVTGRTCDRCSPYHYNFGAMGCTDCACDPQGSINLQCDETTSSCQCYPGIVGVKCDKCSPGKWDFPRCRPCHCNGLSETCNQTTGQCLDCRQNTGGMNCEKCAEGFYGDPLRGTECKPCSCPGGGVNHAVECRMGSLQEQICYCKPGYTGPRCSECAMNYFGNPTEYGGTCEPCQCSGNIDPNEPGGCNPLTGQCLKCLHNSEGFNCDVCKLGYWGDATRQMCQPCGCYPPGSVDEAKMGCDRNNGQCPCLPNVVGARCYECSPGYFNLTSGQGCSPCNCDPSGSTDDKCDMVTGQCRCKSDRSGRKCDQCQTLFYGNPQEENGCKPCDCNRAGAISDYCDPRTGQCPCLTGITGRQCDRCDRGTQGILPHCKPCGQCWTDWDAAIDKVIVEFDRLQNQTGRQLPPELKILFDSLVDLLAQIENVPWAKIDEEKIKSLREILLKTNTMLRSLNSFEPTSDSLNTLMDDLYGELAQETNYESQVAGTKQKLQKLRDRFEKILQEAGQIERRHPEYAHLDVIRNAEIGRRAKVVRDSVASQHTAITGNIEKLQAEWNAVESRGSSLDEDWLKLDSKIGEFRDQVRQINRLLCGDNSELPPEDADSKLCPSDCGGAACDPVARWVGLKLPSRRRRRRSLTPVVNLKTISQTSQEDYETGLLGGCGANPGCEASVGGRLRSLMQKNLEMQVGLADTIQRIYRAESLISKVHANRKDAEDTVKNTTTELGNLREQLKGMLNATTELIQGVQNYTERYGNLSSERFNELIKNIEGAKLNVTINDAQEVAMALNRRALELESRVSEVLRETEKDRTLSANVAERALKTKKNAESFMNQMMHLREAQSTYDRLEEDPLLSGKEDEAILGEIIQTEKQIEGLKSQISMFAHDSSSQADLARGSSEAIDKLLADATMARKESVDTLQQLQNIEISHKQLEEKMAELEKLMAKVDTGEKPDEEGNQVIADPTKLMEQVQNYTARLEKDMAEINGIEENLKMLEEQSNEVSQQLDIYVKKFSRIADISAITKFHRTCK